MRRLIDIIEEQLNDSYAYHVTGVENLPEIARRGLVPHPPDDSGWPEYDPEDYGDDEDVEPPSEAFEPRLFAWDSFPLAQQYMRGYADPSSLRILRMPMDVADWENGWTDLRYIYTSEPVPASAIEVLNGDQWEPLEKNS